MENKIELTRDSSGESDSSDWAVVDEDTSLEWNDEAKYHFRRSNTVTAVTGRDQSFEVSPEHGGIGEEDLSDEDSIEVVSDDANEDRLSSEGQWVRPTKDDLENDKLVECEALNNENFESHDSEVQPDMVWYPVKERNKSGNNEKNCVDNNTKMKSIASSAVIRQLSTSPRTLLVMIFIIGLILGYGLSHGTVQNNPGSGDCRSVVNYRIMVSKLNRENRLLRSYLDKIKSYDGVPHSDISTLNTEVDDNSHHLNVNITLKTSRLNNQQKVNTCNNGDTLKRVVNQSTNVTNSDKNKKELDVKTETVILEGVTFEKMGGNKKNIKETKNVTEPLGHVSLNSTIGKIEFLLASFGRFQVDTEKALLLCVEMMKKMDTNLQVLDSVPFENLSPKVVSKMVKFTLNINKMSRKLVNKIDKSVRKLAVNIERSLEKSNRGMLDKLRDLNNLLDEENIPLFKWPKETVFSEHNTKKQKSGNTGSKRSENLLQSTKNEKKMLKVNEELAKTPINDFKVESNQAKSPSKILKKQVKPMEEKKLDKKVNTAKESQTITKNRRVLKSDVNRNVDVKRNEKMCHLKIDRKNLENDSIATEKFYDADNEFVNKTSNVSGEWLIKLGKGRQEQRNYEHQSDWLFDRAVSRKIFRNKDSERDDKDNLRRSQSTPEERVTFKDKAKKMWKDKKQMLKKVIPKFVVGAAESMKNAFKNVRGQEKVRAR